MFGHPVNTGESLSWQLGKRLRTVPVKRLVRSEIYSLLKRRSSLLHDTEMRKRKPKKNLCEDAYLRALGPRR
jgi:hypothetical protein